MDARQIVPSSTSWTWANGDGRSISWAWANGDEMRLTLNFDLLYLLKTQHGAHYDLFISAFSNMSNPSSDQIFDALRIIYTAYLCQQLKCEQIDEALSYEEWLSVIPQDISEALTLVASLISPSEATGETGDEMRLTLNFGLLYLLKIQHKAHYNRFFSAFNNMSNPSSDPIFNALNIIYTAYLCQQLKCEQIDEALSYEEWLSVIPQNITGALTIAALLISPKKTAASETRSAGEPGETGKE